MFPIAKQSPPSRLATVLLTLLLAMPVLLMAWVNNRPITGPVGEPFTITVQAVRQGLETNSIDAGMDLRFHIWRDEETDRLLEADMVGRTFRVLAEKHNPAKGDDYYRVVEMVSEDGSFTYTWEDYAASQAARLPGRLLVVVLCITIALLAICWSCGFFLRP